MSRQGLHPGPAGLVAAAVTAAVAAAVSAAFFPLSTYQVSLARGGRVFEARCASCHEVNEASPSPRGPHLGRIGAEAASRVPEQTAEEFLLAAIIDPEAYRRPGQTGMMPVNVAAGLERAEIISLIGYLMSLGGEPDYRRLGWLDTSATPAEVAARPPVDFAQAERGRALYFGKAECHTCHRLDELPGATLKGPSLLAASSYDEAFLRESIVEPSRVITPGYETWIVELDDGSVVVGRLVRRGRTSIDILMEDPVERWRLVTVSANSIARGPQKSLKMYDLATSPMTGDLATRLTEPELDDLIAFLTSLY